VSTKFLSRADAAKYLTDRGLKISKQSLARIAATEVNGPVYRMFGARAVYLTSDLDAWVEARLSRPRRMALSAEAAAA
jgi:hypothetical protein